MLDFPVLLDAAVMPAIISVGVVAVVLLAAVALLTVLAVKLIRKYLREREGSRHENADRG